MHQNLKHTIMKKQSIGLFSQINTRNFENLTTIISETLACGLNLPVSKKFSTADLWNIQRQGRRRIQRRFSF